MDLRGETVEVDISANTKVSALPGVVALSLLAQLHSLRAGSRC